MKATHIYLKAGQVKQLKAIARLTGAPVAELVRRAVDEFVQRRVAVEEGESGQESKNRILPGAAEAGPV